MDPITLTALATTAVATLSPYLVKMGESAAETLGESSVEGAGKLLGWMKSKLTGRAQEALADLEAAPADDGNRADLTKQIRKALEADPALAAELAALLPAEASGDMVTAIASGDNSVANAVKGSGNQTYIQGR